MSKPQWTPGPWHLDKHNNVRGASEPGLPDGANVAQLGSMTHDGERWRPDLPHLPRWSNAHLIAAAPDEDAALSKAVEWGERYGEERAMVADLGVGEWETFVPPWWHEAKAALAKARGEEAP